MATTRWFRKAAAVALLAAAMAGASGCTSAMVGTTPFRPSENRGCECGPLAKPARADASRVIAWPLFYWERPSGSVLWPLVTFSDEHFGLWPLYSQYRQGGPGQPYDEFNVLWPLAQVDTRSGGGWVFPLAFWGKGWQTVFPFYWNGPDYNALFPLWLKTRRTFTTPLGGWGPDGWWIVPWLGSWGNAPDPGDRYWVSLFGLAAGGHRIRGECLNRWFWVFPLVSRNAWFGKDGRKLLNSDTSVLFGLLGGFSARNGEDSSEAVLHMLFWLGRWRWQDGVLVQSRFFPFWSRRRPAEFPRRLAWLDADALPAEARPIESARRAELLREIREMRKLHKRVFMRPDGVLGMGDSRVALREVPLYSWTMSDVRRWLFVFGRTDTLRGRFADASGTAVAWDGPVDAERCDMEFEGVWGPPFLLRSWRERAVSFELPSGAKTADTEHSSLCVVGPLYRHEELRNGVSGAEWRHDSVLWRVWAWERETPAGGDWKCARSTVLAGLLWDWRRPGGVESGEARFDMLAWLCGWRWQNGTNVQARVFPFWSRYRDPDCAERAAWLDSDALPAEAFGTGDTDGGDGAADWERTDASRWLLLFGNRDTVRGRADDGDGRRVLEETREWGVPLLFGHRHSRTAVFDSAGGAKTGGESRSSFHVLGILYRHDGQSGVPGEADRNRHSVLWRLFRWEKDAEKGTAVDFLFIPVWRSRPDGDCE